MIEIIRDKDNWDTLLEQLDNYDIYHTYDYHRITKNRLDDPILVKYTEGEKTIAIPFLLRKIAKTTYQDLTSVYGYPGPISKNLDKSFNNAHFISELKMYLNSQNIVSIFSRLNPFISHQNQCIQQFGHVSTLNKVVNINLKLDLETQTKEYHKRLRTHVNKARRLCNIRLAETKEDVLAYIDLYYKNMERVNAKKYYFFEERYFFNLLNSNDFNARLLLATDIELNGIIAGAIFITTNQIVQYHLSGTDEDYLNHYPIKLLIDEMRIIAKQENSKFFNLGGGVGNKEDSLFHFKSGFSKDYKDFNLWKVIVNKKIYDQLTLEKNISPDSTYFPLYRSLE